MKIKMTVVLDYEAGDRMDKEEKRWFMQNVLLDKAGLLLHSNEIGDTLGRINVLEVYPF